MPPSFSSPDKGTDTRVTPFSFLLEREERTPIPMLLPGATSGVVVQSSPFSFTSVMPRSIFELLVAAVGCVAVLVGAWSALATGASFLEQRGFHLPASTSLVAGPTFSQASLSASVPLSGTDAASTTIENGIMPVKIDINAIGVHTTIEEVGKNVKGNMGSPTSYKTVAWYSLGTRPGAPGTAAFAGHLNNSLSTAGVFANLADLRVGDTVVLTDEQGHKRTFSVIASEVYPADQPPEALIFATAGPSEIALITCDGAWNKGKKSFDERLVVFAKLVSS